MAALVLAGADVALVDENGRTPLHELAASATDAASASAAAQILQILLRRGARVRSGCHGIALTRMRQW